MIILASKSPRRRQLLEQAGFKNIKIMPATGEEKADAGLSPEELVRELSQRKAREISEKADGNDIVIGADTVVSADGAIFGKPANATEAFAMLATLSGATHQVWTGLTVIKGKDEITTAEMTEVTFRELSDAEIEAYIETGEPMDKAGAYGIQERGALFVESIHGDYFNVMGLPLCRLSVILSGLGAGMTGDGI